MMTTTIRALRTEDENYNNNNQYSVVSTTRVRAREDETEREQRYAQQIADYYAEAIGRGFAPPAVRRAIQTLLRDGFEDAVLLAVIDEASMAPTPSWAYAQAIIRRLKAEGCKTADQWEARQRKWAFRHQPDPMEF